jgi:LysR family hydrogen peroxide-inducible transcriptional activator
LVTPIIEEMNIQELRYFAAVAEHLHFGRAAQACHVSQPTLSGQLSKLERHLGVTLFERTNKRVALSAAGEKILEHARRTLREAALVEEVARASGDQLAGPLKLGVIPTLAPSLIPLILDPLRLSAPRMSIVLWEDFTHVLLDMLRDRRLDAALIATQVPDGDLTATPLFVEPFLAGLPHGHWLAPAKQVRESDLAADILLLPDGHCLAMQTLSVCGRKDAERSPFQAASLDTLMNLVAAGYGTTLIPLLTAASAAGRKVLLRPLAGRASRTVRLVSRSSFPRPQALKAVERAVRKATAAKLRVGRFR